MTETIAEKLTAMAEMNALGLTTPAKPFGKGQESSGRNMAHFAGGFESNNIVSATPSRPHCLGQDNGVNIASTPMTGNSSRQHNYMDQVFALTPQGIGSPNVLTPRVTPRGDGVLPRVQTLETPLTIALKNRYMSHEPSPAGENDWQLLTPASKTVGKISAYGTPAASTSKLAMATPGSSYTGYDPSKIMNARYSDARRFPGVYNFSVNNGGSGAIADSCPASARHPQPFGNSQDMSCWSESQLNRLRELGQAAEQSPTPAPRVPLAPKRGKSNLSIELHHGSVLGHDTESSTPRFGNTPGPFEPIANQASSNGSFTGTMGPVANRPAIFERNHTVNMPPVHRGRQQPLSAEQIRNAHLLQQARHAHFSQQLLARHHMGMGPSRAGSAVSSIAYASQPVSVILTPDLHRREGSVGFSRVLTPQVQTPMSATHHAPAMSCVSGRSSASATPRMSAKLQKLLHGPGGLNANKLLDAEFFPFTEVGTVGAEMVSHGVIKISNTPFHVARNEIDMFLGQNARILPHNMEPIHIIMCRLTGKTIDVFVEFNNVYEATKLVERHNRQIDLGRPSKVGDRPVEVTLSSQEELMRHLFPKARAVRWESNLPVIVENAEMIQPHQEFSGFLTDEEITMMLKHTENPHRCPFWKACPERPYECLISTLRKFPWMNTKCITVRQRYRIYELTFKMLDILINRVERKVSETRLTQGLLRRVTTAAMKCPGFTVFQKDGIAQLVGLDTGRAGEFGQPMHAYTWKHQLTASAKLDFPNDLIEWYINLVGQETRDHLANLPLRRRQEIEMRGRTTDPRWGYFWFELNLPQAEVLDNCTLFEVAEHEFNVIEAIVRRAAAKMAADHIGSGPASSVGSASHVGPFGPVVSVRPAGSTGSFGPFGHAGRFLTQ